MARPDRDEFNDKTIRALQERVNHHCSNPNCREPTSGPHSDPSKSVRVGRAAHITAAAPGGARYDPRLSAEQRSHATNGIWLCAVCADIVDKDEDRYPVGLLLDWKQWAEDEADAGMKGRPKTGNREPVIENPIQCPFCFYTSEYGVTVCVGCDADVVYGSTSHEWKEDIRMGAMASGVLLGFPIMMAPAMINERFGTHIAPLFDLGIYSVLVVGLPAVMAGYYVAKFFRDRRRKEPPRFFRMTHT